MTENPNRRDALSFLARGVAAAAIFTIGGKANAQFGLEPREGATGQEGPWNSELVGQLQRSESLSTQYLIRRREGAVPTELLEIHGQMIAAWRRTGELLRKYEDTYGYGAHPNIRHTDDVRQLDHDIRSGSQDAKTIEERIEKYLPTIPQEEHEYMRPFLGGYYGVFKSM